MKAITLVVLALVITGCGAKKYVLQFEDREKKTVLTLTKTFTKGAMCFEFSEDELNVIHGYDLCSGSLIINDGDVELERFVIISANSSSLYEDKILLCDREGKLKVRLNEFICVKEDYFSKL